MKLSVCRSPSTCSRRYWGLTPGCPCPQDTATAFRPGGVPSLVFLPPAWDTGRALAQPLGAPVRISSASPRPRARLCREFVFPVPGGFLVAQRVKQCGRPGFSSWVRKILWRRAWQPTPGFLPGKSHGQRSLVGYNPWGQKELDTTEQLNVYFVSGFYWASVFFQPIWTVLMK